MEGRSGPILSHLFFADDLLLFSEASRDQISCIREGFEEFYRASGQNVNYHKSLLFCSPTVSE